MRTLTYAHVTKTYPNAADPAVRDVSFTVPAGRFVVFLGPSGCGKTTLLKMTNRLIEPSSGTITLDGVDIRTQEVTQLRRRMGYVIQQVGLFPHLTAGRNVAVVPELLKWPAERVRARVDELLDLVSLDPAEFRDRYPAHLSGGQQQRVGLARALAADPEVLLMDEPFGAIDAITRASLQSEIRALHRRLGKTILFVTHDVDEALLLADEIAILRAGELVQYGPPCEILTRPASDFVRSLLNTEDRVRALGLMRVEAAMTPLAASALEDCGPGGPRLPAGQLPRIPASASLRDALSLFLQPGTDCIGVVSDGQVVGTLTWEQVRSFSCGGEPGAADRTLPET